MLCYKVLSRKVANNNFTDIDTLSKKVYMCITLKVSIFGRMYSCIVRIYLALFYSKYTTHLLKQFYFNKSNILLRMCVF